MHIHLHQDLPTDDQCTVFPVPMPFQYNHNPATVFYYTMLSSSSSVLQLCVYISNGKFGNL